MRDRARSLLSSQLSSYGLTLRFSRGAPENNDARAVGCKRELGPVTMLKHVLHIVVEIFL